MRIDAYNQIAQIYGTRGVGKAGKAQSSYGASSATDQVSISEAGRAFQLAKKAVSEASDVREDRVAQIKAMVDAGEYKVKEEDFAGKLIAGYGEKVAF